MVWGHNIIGFLTKLPTNPDEKILARRFREVTLPDRHMTVMWYCQGQQIVLVGLEKNKQRGDYLADEEQFNNEPPLYFSEGGHYSSPVYLLKQLRNEVEKELQSQRLLPYAIWIVYITNNRIINKEGMKDDVWLPKRVLVFDHVLDFTDDFCVESASEIQTGIDAFRYADEHTKWTQMTDEEMDAALREFVDRDDDDEDEDEIDDEDEEDTEEESPVETKGLFDFRDDDFDPLFPFGKPSSSDEGESKPHKASTYVPKLEDGMRAEVYPCMENPDEVFNNMVGCQEIREQIRQLTTLHRYNLKMREYNPGAQLHDMTLHAIFHGSPGTGKTTLCRLYASLLYKAGALSNGHVVVASRSTFLGTNFGDEEKMVYAVLEAAKGGVLMIDEAYLLNPPHPNDPGKHVLQLMMPILADENIRDIAIVLCGYSEPMEKLLSLNDGLASRFPNQFKFPDFTVPQLLDISKQRVKKYDYHFTPKAWKLYKEVVNRMFDHRDKKKWGNAREMAHLLDKIYIHHANRCMSASDPKKMFTITVADIKPVESTLTFKPQPHIGFR